MARDRIDGPPDPAALRLARPTEEMLKREARDRAPTDRVPEMGAPKERPKRRVILRRGVGYLSINAAAACVMLVGISGGAGYALGKANARVPPAKDVGCVQVTCQRASGEGRRRKTEQVWSEPLCKDRGDCHGALVACLALLFEEPGLMGDGSQCHVGDDDACQAERKGNEEQLPDRGWNLVNGKWRLPGGKR